jgi:hypothetical protein
MTAIADMNRSELRAAAKAAGIKYGKLSLMQIREALTNHKPAKAKKSGERKQRTGTKMEAALAVMEKHPGLVRKQIIAKFIDDVGLTKAGANTYYALVQKKLKTK